MTAFLGDRKKQVFFKNYEKLTHGYKHYKGVELGNKKENINIILTTYLLLFNFFNENLFWKYQNTISINVHFSKLH